MIIPYILTIFFSIIATAILSYISMAVLIGPWIHSVIIILCSILFFVGGRALSHTYRVKTMSLITAGSSLGGILATGCGFAFPTLYFLDPTLFNSWLSSPPLFIGIMAAVTFTAGACGLMVASLFEKQLIEIDALPFPIGEVSYTLIAAHDKIAQVVQLLAGCLASILYLALAAWNGISQRIAITHELVLRGLKIPAVKLPVYEFPVFVAIGYIAGHIILVPLSIGIVSKILLMMPAHEYFFSYLTFNDFSFAFVSGMVLYGALMSLLELPNFFVTVLKRLRKGGSSTMLGNIAYTQWLLMIVACSLMLSWFNFGLITQLYLLLFTALCTYQLLIIGGELGIAPIPRYATFVMMPAILLFGLGNVQLTVLCTFVEVCGGVAVDVLFGRKLGKLSEVNHKQLVKFQWLGLLVSSLSVGVIFWLLIKKFGLDAEPLIAQRAKTRALNIQFHSFDFYAMVLGALYGTLLKDFKISPIMVLGGILMPFESALSLIIGGALATLLHKPRNYDLFWSGVFASASIIMIIKAMM